jgi:predicted dienelactone hydrolase
MQAIAAYPTGANAGSLRIRAYWLDVAEDAEPAPGPHPLIIFSHGRGGLPESYNDLFTALARRGFVVAGVAHPRDNYYDASGSNDDVELVDRTRHVVRLIDYLTADWPLRRSIDAARIGFVGHSAGGYTGLLLLGGAPDFAELGGRCRGNPNLPPGQARVVHDEARLPVTEPRIRAAVVMAPAFACLFDKGAFAPIATPLLLYRSGRDELIDPRFNADYVARHLSRPAELVDLADAGHFVYLAPCPFLMRIFARTICTDPAGVDRVEVHRTMQAEIAAFFERTFAHE